MCFDPKLGHGTYEISCIPCEFTKYTSIIDKPWYPGVSTHQQPLYQPVTDLTDWPVLGSFKNLNIVKFSHKDTYSEDIEKIIRLYLKVSATTWLHWFK